MEDEEVIEAGEVGEQEVRWKQRFKNFNKAFGRLSDAIQILQKEPENVLMQAGLIQTYEFTFEVAWKTLKWRDSKYNLPGKLSDKRFNADISKKGNSGSKL